MKLKDWRKKKEISQTELADRLYEFADKNYPARKKNKIGQRTICAWERGGFPRPFWLKVIEEYTYRKVSLIDFLRLDAQ